jgi:hypothetical protein
MFSVCHSWARLWSDSQWKVQGITLELYIEIELEAPAGCGVYWPLTYA